MIQRLYTAEKMEEKYKVLREIDEFDVCDDERPCGGRGISIRDH